MKLHELRDLYVCGNYERTTLNLLEAANANCTSAPINIREILNNLNIYYSQKTFEKQEEQLIQAGRTERIQGMLRTNGDEINIFYNPSFNGEKATNHKINFTLAHELAHCILHAQEIDKKQGYVDFYRTDGHDDEKEREANTLAGEILMPKKTFSALYSILKQNNSFQETVEKLSYFFDVSINVVKARIEYLGL